MNKENNRSCRVYYLFWDVERLHTVIKHYTFPVKDVRLVSLDSVLGTVVMAAGNGCITLWKNIDDVSCNYFFLNYESPYVC